MEFRPTLSAVAGVATVAPRGTDPQTVQGCVVLPPLTAPWRAPHMCTQEAFVMWNSIHLSRAHWNPKPGVSRQVIHARASI
jgi:hypothetical protein